MDGSSVAAGGDSVGAPAATLEHVSESPRLLPPDLERLQVIRAWLEHQQARNETIGIYLQVLREHVDAAIAAATPPARDGHYRLQGMRTPPGRSVLHRDDCWVAGGTTITRSDALTAMDDPVIRPGLEMCEACRPEDGLRGERAE